MKEFLKPKRSLNGPTLTAALARGGSSRHLVSRSRDGIENQKHWHQKRVEVEGATTKTNSFLPVSFTDGRNLTCPHKIVTGSAVEASRRAFVVLTTPMAWDLLGQMDR